MEIFNQSPAVNIEQVLANRDRRVKLQASFLTDGYPTVIAIKLNIPGPVKNGPTIRQYFEKVNRQFEMVLKAQGWPYKLALMDLGSVTGPESFYQLHADPKAAKKLTSQFEEDSADHRLLDMDVIYQEGSQTRSISRADLNLPARTCLICGRLAKDCGRSRRHTVAELQAKVAELIEGALQ
ncbi:citrate lyase holo-[acyl-carrier protein] synthase [Limosilactobacillus gastricus]|uniref:citrate lyase holo-[acyl-carrier protein] synthase n=1 Tax=Limosilactobacillus gastricus DSM 16045 TaxID=1423749 RepID=A0A0R1VDD8_9LACO|nr:citrate lyase holo-[acyl-carrier protein] synthase [Limosilactobacillus gastricus]KRM01289.1 Triphosphoribosyl-dephospho-CoA synthase [Limosilactobacillus gastricus DSM 16045]QGF40905.1 citrate lyase holo-[acyl-carrier protein] synthase [Limosilactobacillus gastricus]